MRSDRNNDQLSHQCKNPHVTVLASGSPLNRTIYRRIIHRGHDGCQRSGNQGDFRARER